MVEGHELLDRGFELAYFLMPVRSVAREILGHAMSNLNARHSRERKRIYWREKHLRNRITRIVRDRRDILQWLIFTESEKYEMQQEQAEQQTTSDMVIRYIKTVIQAATSLTAVYVSVGIQRLLHDYNASEARKSYEWLTHRYPSDAERRKVKAMLISRLEQRFGHYLKTYSVQRGEIRFQTSENQAEWTYLVDACLKAFTPWSTIDQCGAGTLAAKLAEMNPKTKNSDSLEAQRCHVFIDPNCFSEMMGSLGLSMPNQRRAIPKFFFNGSDSGGGSNNFDLPPKPDPLTEEERALILDRLEGESAHRQSTSPDVLTIDVDGRPSAWLDVKQRTEHRCEIKEGAKLVQIWTEKEGRKLLWAVHWIEYTEENDIANMTSVVDLNSARELMLRIIPIGQGGFGEGVASLVLQCRPSSAISNCLEWLGSSSFWRGMPKIALATTGLLAIGWLAATVSHRQQTMRQEVLVESLKRKLAERQNAAINIGTPHATHIEVFRLTPNNFMARGPQSDLPVVTVLAKDELIILELPVEVQPVSYTAILESIPDNRELLREDIAKATWSDDDKTLRLIVPSTLLTDGFYKVHLDLLAKGKNARQSIRFIFHATAN